MIGADASKGTQGGRLYLLGPGLAALLFLTLASWSWGRWPDILVDFGRELYVPWRLSSGAQLYRDLAYFNGPLSPYLNALWFDLFGVGLRTLVWANLVLLGLLCVVVWRVLRRVSDPVAANVGLLVFLSLFAFNQLTLFGNYNYVTPYSHEMTHGVLLSLGALLCALGSGSPPGRLRFLLCGLLLGLAFLTKPEIFLAAIAAVASFLFLQLGSDVQQRAAWRQASVLALAGLLVVPAAATLLLTLSMPVSEALAGILRGWSGVLAGDVAGLAFYSTSLGLDEIGGNLVKMATAFAVPLLVLAAAAVVDVVLGRRFSSRWWVPGLLGAVTLGSLLALPVRWIETARPLPLLMLVALALALGELRRTEGRRAVLARRVGFSVFGLVLLAKVLLYTRIGHYGFVLAMPATLVLVALLVCWVPEALERLGGSGRIARAVGLALLAALCWGHLRISHQVYAVKDYPVATAPDRFLAFPRPRAPLVEEALRRIEQRFPEDATLLVLPEGVMLNYLLRRPTPTRFISFMPPELILFGEERMLEALDAHPPDGVILVHKDTSEYGLPLFGRDYGRRIFDWVERRYRPVTAPLGHPPLQPGSVFGISILEARDS